MFQKKIYSSNEKKPLTPDDLVKLLNIGLGNYGYWNYHHRILQNEHNFNILSVLYSQYDFAIFMDHGSGHSRKREDELDEKMW